MIDPNPNGGFGGSQIAPSLGQPSEDTTDTGASAPDNEGDKE